MKHHISLDPDRIRQELEDLEHQARQLFIAAQLIAAIHPEAAARRRKALAGYARRVRRLFHPALPVRLLSQITDMADVMEQASKPGFPTRTPRFFSSLN